MVTTAQVIPNQLFNQFFSSGLSFLFNRFTSYTPLKFENQMRVKINCSRLDLNPGLQPKKQMANQCAISPMKPIDDKLIHEINPELI